MNKMKKALLLALSLAMSATLFAACGKNKGGNGGSSSSSESSSEVSTPVDSDSSETDSDSSETDSDSSNGGVVTPATYAFTKVLNRVTGDVESVELEEGAALDLTAPSAEGKTFKGWIYLDGSAVAEGATMGTEAVTIYATWEIQAFEVKVKKAGKDDVVLHFGVESCPESETNPEIISIDMISWTIEGLYPDTPTVDYVFEGMPEKWELKPYEINVTETTRKYAFTKVLNPKDKMNGRVMTEVAVGEALDLADPEEVEGKIFKGWIYVNAETGEETAVEEGTKMGTAPVVIYAKWEITTYTVTMTLDGEAYKTLTFGVEGNDDAEAPIFGLEALGFNVNAELPKDSKTMKYTVTGIPSEEEGWKLQNYEINITSEKVDDEDITSSIAYFDRLDKNIMNGEEKDKIKENKYNYWDGSASSVTVANQKEVTNGSDFAVKVSFNVNNLTADELANVPNGSWKEWGKKDMWVGFAIPVAGIDLTNYELTFDMKLENTRTTFNVYAANDYEGEGAVYAVDKSVPVNQADAEDLGNGWYRYTVAIDTSWGVGTAADYIVLSLDNTGEEVDNTKDSIAYIDNLSMEEIFYYTVSVDGEEETVREGTLYTLETPKKDGHKFLGWKDADGNPVADAFEVTGDVTITSEWEELPPAMALYKNVKINLGNATYKVVSFTADAGVYNISLTGGIRAKALNEDGTVGDDIEELTFTEAGTQIFAIYEGDDWETTGTVMMSKADAFVRYSIWRDGKYALEATTDMAAPLGFDSVVEFDWMNSGGATKDHDNNPETPNIPYYSQDLTFPIFVLSNNDISMYTDLYFAIKAVGCSRGYYIAGNEHLVTEDWVYVHLHQAEDKTWSFSYTLEDGTGEENRFTGMKGIYTVNDVPEAYPTIRGLLQYNSDSAFYAQRLETDTDAHVYMTEVTGIKDPNYVEPEEPDVPEVSAPVVSEDAVVLLDSTTGTADTVLDGYTTIDSIPDTVKAPAGFETVMGFEKTLAANANDNSFKGIQIGAYKELWFAMKVVGGKVTTVLNYNGTIDWYADYGTDANGWVYFHLTQHDETENDLPVWTIELVGAKTLVLDDQQPLKYNSLAKILQDTPARATNTNTSPFGDDDDTFYLKKDGTEGTLTVYTTEIRGVKKTTTPAPEVPEVYDPEIAENAVIIADSAIVAGNYLSTYEGEAISAPNGFDKVTTLYSENKQWSSYILGSADMLSTDVTGYTEVWFAIRIDNGYISHTPSYTKLAASGKWAYFHLTQEAAGTWTVEVTVDGKPYTYANEAGTTIAQILDNNTKEAVAEGTNSEGAAWTMGDRIVFYQNRDEASLAKPVYVYLTEVVGVEKEVVVEPFEPTISEDAQVVRSYLWRDDQYALSASTEMTAPEGYSNVIEFNWADNPKNWAEDETGLQIGTIMDDTVDISNYSDLYFAVKMTGGNGIYINGGDTYTGSEWLYAYYHKDATAGTWSLSLKAGDVYSAENVQTGIVSTTLKGLMAYSSMSQGKAFNAGFYPIKDAAATGVIVYYTEVLGVYSGEYDELVADSAIANATQSSGVGILAGYNGLYEKADFAATDFAAVDVSAYSTVSFGLLTSGNLNIKMTDANKAQFMAESPKTVSDVAHTYASIGYANFRNTTSSAGDLHKVILVNNGDGSWTVTINATVYYDPSCDTTTGCADLGTQNMASYTTTVTGVSTLSDIMAAVLAPNAGITVYCTEVRGVAKVVEEA